VNPCAVARAIARLSNASSEEIEPGARHLRCSFDIDRTEYFAEFDVVARRKSLSGEIPWLTDDVEHGEVRFIADGCAVIDDIGYRKPGGIEFGCEPGCFGIGVLDSIGKPGCFGHQCVEFGFRLDVRRVLLDPTLQRSDALAQLLLLRAHLIEGLLGRAAANIEIDQRVDDGDIFTASALGFTQHVGGFAQQRRIDHATKIRRWMVGTRDYR